jgi:PhnB protein
MRDILPSANNEVMTMAVKYTPESYHTVTPYLVVRDAAAVIDFAQKVFDAKLHDEPMKGPDGKIMHAEVKIGDSIIMVGEPKDGKLMPAMLYIYVPDTDATYKKAVQAGGKSIREPEDQFYGDRSAGVEDSNGIQWWIGTHKEDVTPEEMKKRAAEYAKAGK